MKLTDRQQDLLLAMYRGVVVAKFSWNDGYWWRRDNYAKCTAPCRRLLALGLAAIAGSYGDQKAVLTDEGRQLASRLAGE